MEGGGSGQEGEGRAGLGVLDLIEKNEKEGDWRVCMCVSEKEREVGV